MMVIKLKSNVTDAFSNRDAFSFNCRIETFALARRTIFWRCLIGCRVVRCRNKSVAIPTFWFQLCEQFFGYSRIHVRESVTLSFSWMSGFPKSRLKGSGRNETDFPIPLLVVLQQRVLMLLRYVKKSLAVMRILFIYLMCSFYGWPLARFDVDVWTVDQIFCCRKLQCNLWKAAI